MQGRKSKGGSKSKKSKAEEDDEDDLTADMEVGIVTVLRIRLS